MIRFKEQTELTERDENGNEKPVHFNQGDVIEAETMKYDLDHTDLILDNGSSFMGIPNDLFEEV